MNTITDVPDEAYAKVRLLAQAWGISGGEAVARLVDHFARGPIPEHRASALPDGSVPIYVIYEGVRIDASFDPATRAVTIKNGKLKDKTCSSPSGAAVAVVSAYNPAVNPNRNGWIFWFLAENGELLQTIRTRPAARRAGVEG